MHALALDAVVPGSERIAYYRSNTHTYLVSFVVHRFIKTAPSKRKQRLRAEKIIVFYSMYGVTYNIRTE
jgi:hypothetical protein